MTRNIRMQRPRKATVGTASNLPDIQTRDLPDKSLRRYRYVCLLGDETSYHVSIRRYKLSPRNLFTDMSGQTLGR
jgi:hypothetical protein